MKKKILSLVLVVAMLASMLVFAPTSSATETPAATVRTTDAAGSAGETVSVDVMLTTPEVKTLTLIFEYDASRLELLGYDAGAKFPGINSNYDTNAAYLQWTNNGPYKTLGFASLSGIVDCTTETLFATLNFRVKTDAPLGDAFVGFRHLEGTVKNPTTGEDNLYYAAKIVPAVTENVIQEAGMIEYITSAVTVLPAGYASAISVPESAWDFEDGVIYGMLDDSIADATGALVIPSQIGGAAVTEIGAAAFDGYSFSTIVIPASVEYVAAGAIYNCANLTKAYVLNPAAELAEGSIGYEGSWRGTALRNAAILLNADETGALTTIYGAAGSTAETYANAGDGVDTFPFVAEGVNTLSFAGNTYLVGAVTKAPGMMEMNGKTVVAWTDGENTYAAGSTMNVNGSVSLEPISINTPTMNKGVGFQITGDVMTTKMRYTTTIAKADYEELAKLGTVTMGTILTPAAYVSMAGGLTKEALENLGETEHLTPNLKGNYAGVTYIDIVAGSFFQETATEYVIAGSLTGFKAENIDLDYAAAFYMTVKLADGSTFTVYSSFDFGANRSVGATIEAAIAAAKADPENVDEQQVKDLEKLEEQILANTTPAEQE